MCRKLRSILVIPPSGMTFGTYKRRQSEIARHLAGFYRVYYLYWQVSQRRDLLSRIRVAWRDPFRRLSVRGEGNFSTVQLPMLRGPFKLTEIYNQAWLARLIDELSPDFVFSASTFLHPLPKRNNIVYCYDFRDIPTTEMDNFFYRRRIRRHVRGEVKKADLLTAVSHRLIEYIEREYGQPTYYLPNGVDMAEFEGIPAEEVDSIRERFGLCGLSLIHI